jgi:hypothetical protein
MFNSNYLNNPFDHSVSLLETDEKVLAENGFVADSNKLEKPSISSAEILKISEKISEKLVKMVISQLSV